MSASLKNAVKRKTHKERAQPTARRKFGLLEKKKDYLLRAKDFHKKEDAIRVLRGKAEARNPDEFYFAMEKARTKDGVHVVSTSEPNRYSQEELRLMKTQDVGYLTLKAQAEAKKVERLRSSLHMIGMAKPRHTVFVDGEEEAAAFDPAAYFDTHPDLVGRAFNRPRTEQLANPPPVAEGDTLAGVAARSERRRATAYKELLQRQARGEKLSALAARMAYAKEVAGKGRKRKLTPAEAGGQKGVFKWKAERKR